MHVLLALKDGLDKGQGIKGGVGKGLQFEQGYYISNKGQGQGYYNDKGQQGQGYYRDDKGQGRVITAFPRNFFCLPASAGSGIVTVLGIFLLF